MTILNNRTWKNKNLFFARLAMPILAHGDYLRSSQRRHKASSKPPFIYPCAAANPKTTNLRQDKRKVCQKPGSEHRQFRNKRESFTEQGRGAEFGLLVHFGIYSLFTFHFSWGSSVPGVSCPGVIGESKKVKKKQENGPSCSWKKNSFRSHTAMLPLAQGFGNAGKKINMCGVRICPNRHKKP